MYQLGKSIPQAYILTVHNSTKAKQWQEEQKRTLPGNLISIENNDLSTVFTYNAITR